MADFEANHYFLVFDLTSSREAGKALTLFPELTGAGVTLKLSFPEALRHPIELFLVGERFSQDFIDGTRNISTFRKTASSVDNITLALVAQRVALLRGQNLLEYGRPTILV